MTEMNIKKWLVQIWGFFYTGDYLKDLYSTTWIPIISNELQSII